VARLIERKGQAVLLDAVERLARRGAEVVLELVGTGDALGAYRERARALAIGDRVCFTGYVPREKIAARYAAAHVFVLPSYNEGMSVATLEAMAAGLPIVTTKTGGTEELVEESVNGFVFEPGDVPALTSHLSRLAGDRGLARRMGKASRIRAEGFSWEAVAQKYLSLFAGVAASG
jgi:glycosyltransferase involved in cell wall biosynthesis